MIDWLNDNSGAIQALSVIVLIMVTGYYAWKTKDIRQATERQADASRDITNEMREQRLAEQIPLLLIDLLDYNTGGKKVSEGRAIEDCYPEDIRLRVRRFRASDRSRHDGDSSKGTLSAKQDERLLTNRRIDRTDRNDKHLPSTGTQSFGLPYRMRARSTAQPNGWPRSSLPRYPRTRMAGVDASGI